MSPLFILRETMTLAELHILAQEHFGDMVKAVVDCERKIMAIGGELHADEEQLLLEDGSRQEHLWGINLYPERTDDWIEFDSMINIRPGHGNRSRSVDDPALRAVIIGIASELIQ